MSGATTIRGLPYPSGTDKTRGGAAAIQALAEAIDPLLLPSSYMIRNHTATLNLTTGVWTLLTMSGTETNNGTDLTASGQGVAINRAGLYQFELLATMGAVLTGSPAQLGISSLTGSGANGFQRVSGFGQTVAGVWSMRCSVGDTVGGWMQQSSGATVAVTNRRFSARRVGT